MDYTLIKGLLKAVLLPPVGLVVLALVGLVIARRRTFGSVLAAFSLLSLLAMSLPIVAHPLTAMLGAPEVLAPGRAAQAQAIVIPAGGLRENAPEYGGVTLSALTAERVRYGAWLAKRTALPLMVTGGGEVQGKTEAELMRIALLEEYGVAVRWVEARAQNTQQNAAFAAQMLLPQGITRIVLVGHIFDTRRFALEFQRAGFSVIAAPTGPRTANDASWRDWVPSIRSLEASHFACYELVANALIELRGVLAFLLPARLMP